MIYVVVSEETGGPRGGTIVEYTSGDAAEAAIRRYLATLESFGASITGSMDDGYSATWHQDEQRVALTITLRQVP